MNCSTNQNDWTWYPHYQLYYSASTNTWARVDQDGKWEYIVAGDGVTTGAGTENGSGNGIESGAKISRAENEENGGKREDEGVGIEDVGWSFDLPESSKDAQNKVAKGMGMVSGSIIATNGTTSRESKPTYTSQPVPNHPSSSSSIEDPSLPSSRPKSLLRLVILSTSILPSSIKVVCIDSNPEGIQIGRDKSYNKQRIRLKEMEISKVHAGVWWSEEEVGGEGWFVVDNGSTHGTYLLDPSEINSKIQSKPKPTHGKRLSETRQSSRPYRLQHLSRLSMGSTIFECHLHDDWPCEECVLTDTNGLSTDVDSYDTITAVVGNPETETEADETKKYDSPITLKGDWKTTEERKLALTAQAKKDDQTRRSRLAMQNLKSAYFGDESGSSTSARRGGNKKRKVMEKDDGWGRQQDGRSLKVKRQDGGDGS